MEWLLSGAAGNGDAVVKILPLLSTALYYIITWIRKAATYEIEDKNHSEHSKNAFQSYLSVDYF